MPNVHLCTKPYNEFLHARNKRKNLKALQWIKSTNFDFYTRDTFLSLRCACHPKLQIFCEMCCSNLQHQYGSRKACPCENQTEPGRGLGYFALAACKRNIQHIMIKQACQHSIRYSIFKSMSMRKPDRTRQGGDTAQITDSNQSYHKC